METEEHSLLSNNKSSNGPKQIYFYLTWILAFLLIGFIILTIVFIVLFGLARNEANKAAQVCTTPGCVSLTTEMLASLDETKSPCQDFYQFACGGWEKVNVIPEGSGSFSLFSALSDRITNIVSKVLQNNTDTSAAVEKASILYKNCMNTTAIDAEGKQPLVDLLTTLGGWKLANIGGSGGSWDFGQLLQAHLKGGPAFFGVGVGADAKNSKVQAISLGQNGLSLSQTFYTKEKLTAALLTYMKSVVTLLGGSDSAAVDAAMNRVLQLEANLSEIFYTNTELRSLQLTYNPMSLANFSSTFPLPSPFNWLTFMKGYFKKVGKEDLITNDTVVIIDTPRYFGNLTTVLDKFTTDDFDNYVKWTVARAYIPYLSEPFRTAHNTFTAVVFGTGKSPRYKTCTSVATNSLQYAISRVYSLSNVISGTRNKMNAVIDNIQNSFKVRLDEKPWLDAETKSACKSKVDAITRQIAYPDFIFNVSRLDALYAQMNISEMQGYFDNVEASDLFHLKDQLNQFGKPSDKTRWEIPPTAVNAYYSPSFNQFVFLEGILNPPFFNPEWPDYFLYGAIGVVVGHELSHGFDDQGQKYDASGNYRQWWTPQSVKNFEERTKCFASQYSNYSVDGYRVNGQLTLGENIADNGGLHTSYQAYKKLADGLNLPAINGKYTHNQMFFIGFAQVWCTLYTPQYLQDLTETNPHSPGTIRVLGTLSNSQEFADAFSCPSSAVYNPVEKCQLW
jgi:endothelin-converting enzyme